MRRVHARLAVPLFLAVTATACLDRSPTRQRALATPQRIVSLIPSVTELIVALGASHRLVGRTTYDREPSLVHLPVVGGVVDPSLERLVAQRPDVVFAWPAPEGGAGAARLHTLGIRVEYLESETLADLWRTLETLDRVLALWGAGVALRDSLQRELAAVAGSVRGRVPRPVFYVVWHDPPMTAGPDVFISELIEVAGGRNIFADALTRWPTVSLETAVLRNPAVVIVPTGTPGSLNPDILRQQSVWRELPAVREGRVLAVDAELYNRPGPRIAEAARRLVAALHPDLAREAEP